MSDISKDRPKVNDTKIGVKKVPFRCPVCAGYGTLKYGTIKCHACNGKGFIVVPQEEADEK